MRRIMSKPCEACPYLLGGELKLDPERLAEFWESHVLRGETFYCHKTCEEGEDGVYTGGFDSAECAGAMFTRWKIEEPSQLDRVSVALGLFNPDEIPEDVLESVPGNLGELVKVNGHTS